MPWFLIRWALELLLPAGIAVVAWQHFIAGPREHVLALELQERIHADAEANERWKIDSAAKEKQYQQEHDQLAAALVVAANQTASASRAADAAGVRLRNTIAAARTRSDHGSGLPQASSPASGSAGDCTAAWSVLELAVAAGRKLAQDADAYANTARACQAALKAQ